MNRWLPGVLAVQSVALTGLLVIALDQYAHKRVETYGGVNTWGYRGRTLPQRQQGEVRIAVLGGDYAFGWGVAARETAAAYLETAVSVRVQRPGRDGRIVRVANLGALGLPARDYAARLRQFSYLQPDVICLYVDLEDSQSASVLPAADSLIYRVFGYAPILPLVLMEKGERWVDSGRPISGTVVRTAGLALRAVDGGLSAPPPMPHLESRVAAVSDTLEAALGISSGVAMVLPMPRGEAERRSHQALLAMITTRMAVHTRLRVVDLAGHPRMGDEALRLDGGSFSAAAHSLTADAILPAVLDLLGEVPPS